MTDSIKTTSAQRLRGRVALVTGGGSGIGQAAALAYAREGAIVAVCGRRLDALEETAALIRAAGGEALALVADVAAAAQVREAVERIGAHYGRLDIAFNNAGAEGKFAPITELEEDDFDQVVGVNLKGIWLSMKYEIGAMLAFGNGGAIVNTSSWLARKAVPGSSAYAASKGGIDAMMWALAQEVGPQAIRINTIYPGVIDTPMYHRLGTDEQLAGFAAATPLRRAGLPADVGDVAVWLSCDEARFVTGQGFAVDGGFTLAAG
jgi:NAD(P)-dependent dehydrogenase (short-subunit alcohol dehydrogenase family)